MQKSVLWTRALVLKQTFLLTCSNDSGRRTPRGHVCTAGWVWALPSSGILWSRMEARSMRTAPAASKVPRLSSNCRCAPRRTRRNYKFALQFGKEFQNNPDFCGERFEFPLADRCRGERAEDVRDRGYEPDSADGSRVCHLNIKDDFARLFLLQQLGRIVRRNKHRHLGLVGVRRQAVSDVVLRTLRIQLPRRFRNGSTRRHGWGNRRRHALLRQPDRLLDLADILAIDFRQR